MPIDPRQTHERTQVTARLRDLARALLLGATLYCAHATQAADGSYLNFETIPNRALALSPCGDRLFVTNTPAARLEILRVTAAGLVPEASVQVGLDPIAVAVRSESEVWVVNHLSDSVSVVDVSGSVPRVVRTLLVGDEPRDIVFAGPAQGRAFISAARRGQNHPADIAQELLEPGRPRADVWVFDAARPGTRLGGEPLAIVPLFGDKAGGLAASPDGARVYAGIFSSGNQTAVISQESVCGPLQADGPCDFGGASLPGGVPAPNANQRDGAFGPQVGTLVRFEPASGAWRDVLGRDWRGAVRFSLPDRDVFQLDALADPPAVTGSFAHVGTLNAGLAVHPAGERLYVATQAAINGNRFLSLPGLGLFPNPDGTVKTADPGSGHTLNGHLYEARIAIVDGHGGVQQRHLNKHIDYEQVPAPAGVRERSVSQPHSLTFSPDGATLYVTALGSHAIAALRTRDLDDDRFTPDAAARIALSGGGPTNLVIDPASGRGYVYTRFDNAVAEVDLVARRERSRLALPSPEPAQVTRGRRFFYDATLTSSNGEASCAVCHPAGDKDDLAWDLGAPFLGKSADPNPVALPVRDATFNPLKGPMTVLTLRGIADSGPLLWRGDATNPEDPRDVRRNFAALNGLFPALLGREAPLAADDFAALTDWALRIMPPPNPVRRLDGSLTARQQAGSELYFGLRGQQSMPCARCHLLDPARRFFGTAGQTADVGQGQNFKIPHLRNQYDKVGMFGRTDTVAGVALLGPQVRGSGARHDGSNAGLQEFLSRSAFMVDATERAQLADFVHAFPTNLAPIVGQQVTLRADSEADAAARVALLVERARAPFPLAGAPDARECDLVVKGVLGGTPHGFWMQPDGRFQGDGGEAPLALAQLQQWAREPGQELTFSCVYPGAGRRLGLDRDEDGRPDRADPDPASAPPPP